MRVCVLNLILLRGVDPGKLYYYSFSSCLQRNTFYLGNLSDMHMAEQMTRSLDKLDKNNGLLKSSLEINRMLIM